MISATDASVAEGPRMLKAMSSGLPRPFCR